MATFTLDTSIEPTYIDIIDIAAGYGIFSTPLDEILTGYTIQGLSLVVTPAAGGAVVFSKAIDIVQRDDGYFEWTTQTSVDGHFTITAADLDAITAGDWKYSCSWTATDGTSTFSREYQGGAISPRPTSPLPPLVVNDVVVTGGPYTGIPFATHQLTATTYDGYGNVITGFPATWTTTNPAIASVDANGLVTLVTPGTVTITATVQGVSGSTSIVVTTTFTPADGDALFWNAGASTWQPHQVTADRVQPGTFGGSSAYHFAHGLTVDAAGLTVTAGGLTVTAGTSALQAITGTTLALTTALSPAYGGTGVNNGAFAVTLAGNLSTIGAHDISFTTSGTTALTLPTSGTLITTTVSSLSNLASVGGDFSVGGNLTVTQGVLAHSQSWFLAGISVINGGATGLFSPDATYGLQIKGATGATHDFILVAVGGSGILQVPTGTAYLKIMDRVGFYGATPAAKATVSGSRGGNAAVASLVTALATAGLITDGTSA